MRKLTMKQEQFLQEYIKNNGNGTQAAMVAYDGVNPNTARAIASENLAKPNIKCAVDAYRVTMRDVMTETLVGAKNVMRAVIDGATADLEHSDPNVQAKARRFLFEVLKFLYTAEKDTEEKPKSKNLLLPMRNC